MKTMTLVAFAAVLLAGTAASAADGDDNAFKLANKSTVPAIQFFTMLKSGKWSNDWLSTPLAAGATRAMHFNAGDDRCEIRTRVVFADQSEFDTPVNYCDVDNVVLTDKTIFTQ